MSPDWSGGRTSLANSIRDTDESELRGLTSSQKQSQSIDMAGKVSDEIRDMVGSPEGSAPKSDMEALDDDEIEELLAKYYEV